MALSYALPILIGILVYGATWALVPNSLSTADDASGILVAFVTAATVGVLFLAALSIGEEVEWRGFLLPELTKVTSFPIAAIASGLVWAVWHYPLILFAPGLFDFNGLSLDLALPMFTLSLVAVSVVLGWIRLKTGSVWPAVIAHGSHNSFTLTFLNDMTNQSGVTPYLASEVGIGLLVAWAIVALLCWKVYFKSPTVANDASQI